jgi:hypothetical protein
VLFAGGGRKRLLRPGSRECGNRMLRTRDPQGLCAVL